MYRPTDSLISRQRLGILILGLSSRIKMTQPNPLRVLGAFAVQKKSVSSAIRVLVETGAAQGRDALVSIPRSSQGASGRGIGANQ